VKPKILVIDDSRVMQSLVRTYLTDIDADVTVVSSAEEGLASFTANGADVVISDVQMGGMSGIELSRRLKKACGGRVRVILISGAKGEVGTDAYSAGHADAFLAKPIDGGRLNRLVRSFLGAHAPRADTEGDTTRIRVLCADDTRVGRRILERLLSSDPRFELVGMAEDGYEAVELAQTERPQLVLMDVLMPGLDGIEATKRIMQRAPTRVVVVTDAHASPRGARAAFEATIVGALDLLPKPDWIDPNGPEAKSFLRRLHELAEVPVVGRRRRLSRPILLPAAPLEHPAAPEILAFCGSTGGPRVLCELLPAIRAAVAVVPVLIVQHVLPGFDAQLARWLADTTDLPVQLATPGARVRPGHVLLAPHGSHMVLSSREEVDLVPGRRLDRHTPSGDALFESVAKLHGEHGLGVILTGMGEDGLVGLRALRRAGGTIFAQDPLSCVVAGMPETVISEGLANEILGPADLAARIVAVMSPHR
jgi:two-component system chemotaxis response regulator CheB